MSNNVVYPARLENLTLLDGKDIDISGIKEEVRRDYRRLVRNHVFVLAVCIGFLIGMLVLRDLYQDSGDIYKAGIVGIIFWGVLICMILALVGLWKVIVESLEMLAYRLVQSGNYEQYFEKQ
ncbi:MAG: hypothetical protein K6G06_07805 [Butyrivibrio sp.]|nr:hypothetical protein [Butyrivibrio sp.]